MAFPVVGNSSDTPMSILKAAKSSPPPQSRPSLAGLMPLGLATRFKTTIGDWKRREWSTAPQPQPPLVGFNGFATRDPSASIPETLVLSYWGACAGILGTLPSAVALAKRRFWHHARQI